MTLEEMRARLEAIRARYTAIDAAANARAEGERDLTEAEQAEWLALDSERDGLEANVQALESRQRVQDSRARWQGLQVAPGKDAEPTDGVDFRSSFTMTRNDLVSRAQRLLDDGRENVAHLDELAERDGNRWHPDAIRSKVQRLLTKPSTQNYQAEQFARMMLITENPHYRTAFSKILNGRHHFTEAEARALDSMSEMRAALNITTDAQGGYAIPVLIDPSVIWTGQGHPNDFLRISRVENITNDEWKGVTSAGATAYWTTEGVKATDGAPTLAQPVVTTKKLTVYIPYSIEAGGDWPGFAAEMTTAIDLVWNEELVSKFTVGTGNTAQPTGVITALAAVTASQVANTDSGGASAADVYAMRAALPIKYRGTSSWMASTSIENQIRQAGTTDPNFTTNLNDESVGLLFKRPFYENDYMTGIVASTSSSWPLLYGDFKNFLIANRLGMTVETITHVIDTTSGTPTGQRALYAFGRIGSNVINSNGFRLLSQQ